MLKIAGLDDFEDVYKLATEFHAMSPYKDKELNTTKVADTCIRFLTPSTSWVCILFQDKGITKGIIAGTTQELPFSDDRIAQEVIWYVRPEYRKSSVGPRLLKAFEYWAKDVVNADIIQMVSINNEWRSRLDDHYAAKGYKLYERVYLKWLR